MKTSGILALAGSAWMMFAVSNAAALSLPDPLALTATFTPSVSFSESHTDKVAVTDPGDPTNGVPPTYGVVPALSTSATIVADIEGISLAGIDTTTSFSLTFGGLSSSFTLGDIPTYAKGATTAFYCFNGWNSSNKPLGTGGIKLAWTTTKLTVTVTTAASDDANLRPAPIASESYVDPSNDPGTSPGTTPVKDTTSLSMTFGGFSTASPRTIYLTGSAKITHSSSGPADSPLYDFDLYTVTLSGSADYVRPTVALSTPKQGASVGTNADVAGTASDDKGLIGGVQYTTDLSQPWTAVDDFTLTSTPADGLWGANTGAWTVHLTSLPYGTTHLWVESIDDSGNTSTPLLVTLVNPVPPVLTGRWDALLKPASGAPGLGGAVHFTFSANGSYTGTLVLETGSYAFSSSLLADDSLNVSISRGSAAPVVLTGNIASFSPAGTGDAGITANLTVGGTAVASLNAFRSPWSSAVLAPTGLAGTFNVQVASATTPSGNSYAVVTTARSGTASAVFSMADGSVITWSGVLGAAGQLPAFAPLYVTTVKSVVTTHGSVSVPMTIDLMARAVSPTTLTWVRPASFGDKQFPSGFNYSLNASGLAYAAPAAGKRVMALAAGSPNATASWNGDGVTDASPSLGITVNANNTLTIPTTTALNPDALKLMLTPSTGLWTGSFKLTGTSVLTACKLIIVGDQAYGFWTAPAAAGSVMKRFGQIGVK